jgi:hypothetical protein
MLAYSSRLAESAFGVSRVGHQVPDQFAAPVLVAAELSAGGLGLKMPGS